MLETMRQYLLRNTRIAVEHMAKSNAPLHMFDYGTDQRGQKYVFVMAIIPQEVADTLEKQWQAMGSPIQHYDETGPVSTEPRGTTSQLSTESDLRVANKPC